MNRRPILFSAAVILAMLVAGAWAWFQLPSDAQVPVHWDLTGTADVFAHKTMGVLFLPILTAALTAVLAAIPRFEPRQANLERSGKAYRAIWIAAVTLLGLLQGLLVAAALGVAFEMSRIMLVAIGILLMVIGNYLPKVRPNYLMGIRTPWTLSSDLAWVKTHRVGGRLFVIEGVLLVVLGLADLAPVSFVASIIGSMVVLLVVVVAYSYQVWKADPQRRVG